MNKATAPRARPIPEASEARLSPANARRVREGIEQAERGEFADLTVEETRRYIETGELPERTERWLDFHASTDVT
jgi:hypothetical protein